MKKSVINSLFALMIVLVVFLAVGCSKKDLSVYTLKENGVEYTLTLNEIDGTFVLLEKKGDETTEYAGDFTRKDGGVVLSSTNFGYRSVRLTGDTFAFIVNPTGMEEKTPPCEHEWGKVTHVDGDCSHYGYAERTCKKCGEKERTYDTAYGEHVSDDGKHVEGETCTDKGYTVYKCTICKEVLRTVEDLQPSGRHDYVATDTVRDNGCQKPIERLYVCDNCQKETYMTDLQDTKKAHAIGAHNYNADGICTVCKRMKSGLPTVHADKDNDGYCDSCKVKMTVLQGAISSPCGYEENGKTYIGVYPQLAAGQSAKEIQENGLYDEALDVWYYGTETYVLRTVSAYAFVGNNYGVTVGETYAFLLQPLAFTRVGDMYVCDKIIDADAFLQGYAVINSGVTNVWEDSTLYEYLNGEVAMRIGCAEKIESIDLLAVEELPPAADCVKTITDYALAGGIESYGQDRKGKWFLKTAGSQTEKVWCVGLGGVKEEVDVTRILGVVPVIRLKQGE